MNICNAFIHLHHLVEASNLETSGQQLKWTDTLFPLFDQWKCRSICRSYHTGDICCTDKLLSSSPMRFQAATQFYLFAVTGALQACNLGEEVYHRLRKRLREGRAEAQTLFDRCATPKLHSISTLVCSVSVRFAGNFWLARVASQTLWPRAKAPTRILQFGTCPGIRPCSIARALTSSETTALPSQAAPQTTMENQGNAVVPQILRSFSQAVLLREPQSAAKEP